MQVQSLGWEDPLEEEPAAHSSILAWRIPWTEEPGGLQFTGHRSLTLHAHMHSKYLEIIYVINLNVIFQLRYTTAVTLITPDVIFRVFFVL